ncbi:isocitrate lyase/PEP mutase family protein [Novispirillum itersonii]|uniref:2-methylisocitrate lyase-like PEP mutase family enzyme n=1 Tax=Novispirillum itersonii TaxID=189 RepID=A0A7X0DMJ5_NOVIT|nr:isocitrate lyase/phosphoenolpyruvate mutase family protein [Novispirillum itersonii]MBB6211143.1 2-methylisocitrate lyase-like PEP mutase family enzyme [Novispirillum itersonii]
MTAASDTVSKGAAFRRLHDGPGAFVIPNPWDVGSARLLAALGFPALATTSAGMSFAYGVGEGKVPHAMVLEHCRQLVQATPLPVSADLEKGFGDSPEEAAETIRAAAGLGLAGCSLEDFTGDPANPIFETSLAVERIAAAAEARAGLAEDFVLTARCENFLWGRPDLDDTIARLQAFEKAGADVLFAPGLRDLDSIRAVCAAVSRPVNVIMGLPGISFSVSDLAAAGVRRISIGSSLARVAYGAAISAAQEILGTGSFGTVSQAIGFARMEEYFAGQEVIS